MLRTDQPNPKESGRYRRFRRAGGAGVRDTATIEMPQSVNPNFQTGKSHRRSCTDRYFGVDSGCTLDSDVKIAGGVDYFSATPTSRASRLRQRRDEPQRRGRPRAAG
jgi:hypothetical protein